MNRSARQRISLKQRVSGPKAVSVAQLIAQGDKAAQQVQECFWDFLKVRLRDLEVLQRDLPRENPDGAAWKIFYTTVHDIRGSSAVAGQGAVAEICASLEELLLERDAGDIRMSSAIGSHMGALNLLLSRQTTEASHRLLASELARAVESLPLKKRDLRGF